MSGRKPKPAALKKVLGNPGKRRSSPATEPPKPAGIVKASPAPPDHLSDRARSAWRLVGPMLVRNGVLADGDEVALEMLCEAYADYLDARVELEAFGSNYYETKNQAGGVMHRAHPAVAVMRDADRRIRAWLSEFGLTPSARSRVHGEVGDENEDPADRYFSV